MDEYLVPRDGIIEYAARKGMGMGEDAPGIYLLLYKDDIVYVGQATNIHDRLKSHAKTGKQWDRYYCTKCLEVVDINPRVQGNTYSNPIVGAMPK